jgi:hypothetical protein
MSAADKRTVSTDALETLGMIHVRDEKRDAIHLAVIPAEAGENLYPNAHVHLIDGKAYRAQMYSGDAIGVVDPFLTNSVQAGQRFWVVIYPRVITSLRHVWTHPAIADEVGAVAPSGPSAEQKAASEKWLRQWIANADCPSYEIVMAALKGEHVEGTDDYGKAYSNDGEYITFYGRDAHSDIPAEFWTHFEIVTGFKMPEGARPSSFNCSC